MEKSEHANHTEDVNHISKVRCESKSSVTSAGWSNPNSMDPVTLLCCTLVYINFHSMYFSVLISHTLV